MIEFPFINKVLLKEKNNLLQNPPDAITIELKMYKILGHFMVISYSWLFKTELLRY